MRITALHHAQAGPNGGCDAALTGSGSGTVACGQVFSCFARPQPDVCAGTTGGVGAGVASVTGAGDGAGVSCAAAGRASSVANRVGRIRRVMEFLGVGGGTILQQYARIVRLPNSPDDYLADAALRAEGGDKRAGGLWRHGYSLYWGGSRWRKCVRRCGASRLPAVLCAAVQIGPPVDRVAGALGMIGVIISASYVWIAL